MSLSRYYAPDTLPQLCCGEEMHEHASGELECLTCYHTLPADHLTSDVQDMPLVSGFDADEGIEADDVEDDGDESRS